MTSGCEVLGPKHPRIFTCDVLRRALLNVTTVFTAPRDTELDAIRRSSINWLLIAAMLTLAALWPAVSDFRLNYCKLGTPILFLCVIVLGCHIVRARLRLQTPCALIEAVIQFLLVCGGAELLSYELGSLSNPWADPWLAAGDHAMGFDWVGINRWVARHPTLTRLFRLAYQSFAWQPPMI